MSIGFGPIADFPVADTGEAAPTLPTAVISQTWGGWSQEILEAEQGGLIDQTWGGWSQALTVGEQGGYISQTWGGWSQEIDIATPIGRLKQRSVYGFNI